jgi:multiple sugar transport system permease protein
MFAHQPMAKPTTVAVATLTALFYWSDFINPLLFLKSQSLYTLPVGLSQLQQLDKTNWSLLMTGSVMLALPTVLMFFVVQRYFLQDNRLTGFSAR